MIFTIFKRHRQHSKKSCLPSVLYALVATFGLSAFSFADLYSGQKFPSLTTSRNVTYSDVTMRQILPDGVRIMHATGFATIPVEDLPIDLRKTGKFLSGPDLTAYRQALAEREKLAPKQTAIIEQAQAEQARTKHTEETEEERKRTELKQYEQQVKSEQSDHEPSTTPKTESPRIITVEQLKQIWINSLSSPRTLDQNYHQVQRSNREFKNQVVSGTLDSVAWLYVAYLNMNEYNRVGQHEMALLLANRIKEYEQRQEATDRSRAAIGSSMEKDSKIRELEQKVDSLKRDSFFLKH